MLGSLLMVPKVLAKRSELASETDLSIIAITWGSTLGFGFLTTWTAIKQTRHMWKRRGGHLNHPYIWMVWAEIASTLGLSIVCWLVLQGPLTLNVWSLTIILSLWVIQVHCLFQIIINRVSILMVNRSRAKQLKIWVACGILLVNISVFCIWIPAHLEINDTFVKINVVWDRVEKVIILIVDAGLNYYFIRIVEKQLIKPGLTKYRPLVRFNLYMIVLSLAMDLLIIGMLSLKNPLVYLMFHPLAYVVKLKIEMSMAELIAHVSRTQDTGAVQYNGENKNSSSADRSESGTVKGGFNSNVFSPTTTTQSKRASAIIQGSPDVEMNELRSGPSEDPVPFSRFGIISEEADRRSQLEEEEELDTDHQGFIVHRHHEVTQEIESIPSERSGKGNTAPTDYDPRRRTQDSDEQPLRKEVNPMGLATKVWGRY